MGLTEEEGYTGEYGDEYDEGYDDAWDENEIPEEIEFVETEDNE